MLIKKQNFPKEYYALSRVSDYLEIQNLASLNNPFHQLQVLRVTHCEGFVEIEVGYSELQKEQIKY